MRRGISIIAGVAFALAVAAPAIAQNANQKFDQFLSNHPQISSDLQRNPNLLYNENYQKSHKELYDFLMSHPGVTANIEAQRRAGTGMGAYDNNHQWRDSNWWHQNNPNWMYQNHPEWAQNHPEWRNEGDFDNQHKWHDRHWWSDNNPKWVNDNHPEWNKMKQDWNKHEEKKEAHEAHHQ
ncbi:MAG TPA: hypothetical protein VIX12_08015 [Candidatus Binataceae bacterium]